MEKKADGPGTGGPQRPFAVGWALWLLFLIAFSIWSVISALFTHAPAAVTLPYSTFLAQVRGGNVKRVTVAGDQLSGAFVKAYLPAPEPGQTPSPASSPFDEFVTTYPESLGDTSLMPQLTARNVEVDVVPPPSPLLGALLSWVLPVVVLIGFYYFLMRRAGSGPAGALGFGRAKPQRYASDQPKVTFDDVAGADEAKIELQEEVDFLRHPEKYHGVGARIPKGILLVGPPGTGKTLLARAVAGEANVPFFSLNASEFVEMFVGVGASRVRDLFNQAKEAAPAILFIDEIDAVGRRRGAGVGAVNDEREQTLNQLLGELDGFDPRVNIIVLAATNRPDVLDPALLRPGRFDREVTVGLPDRTGRQAILKIHSRKLPLSVEVDLATLAGQTIGMNGADLENLCNEAALGAARHDRRIVTMPDFEEALDRVRLGAAHPHLMDEEERRIVAYHESGHTVVAWLTPGADPVQKVTIVPRGQTLGVTEQLPAIERHNLSKAYLKTRLAVMLGGRTAEELVFNEVTTGAESDLVSATGLARQMVTTWGMGTIGLLAFKSDESQPFLGYELAQNRDYSDETAAQIDADVRRFLDEAHEAARSVLSDVRPQLDAIVDSLCKNETVDSDELTRILGPRRTPLPLDGTPPAPAPAS